MHKPGYATSEFWLTALVSVPAFLVGAGLIPTGDQAMLTDAVSKFVSGIVAAVTIYKYIHSRATVKSAFYETLPIKPVLAFALILCGGINANAQQPTCLFGWRAPDYSALLTNIQGQNAQILAQNQQIMAMLAAQKQSAPSQPAQPPMIVFAPPSQGGPLQQIPLGANPYQTIPLGPPPLQQIPLGGPPAQQIPIGGPPQQQIPIGSPPAQQIPLGQGAPQTVPLVPVPQQTSPPPLSAPLQPPAAPQQSIPLGPPPAAPSGYQRYTTRPSYSSALYHSPTSPVYVWSAAR
jgi:hypothetical protein